jgi:hypothetical protein
VYLSYHHESDGARAEVIRNHTRLHAPPLMDDESWNLLMRQGTLQVEACINQALTQRSCLIVLISRFTRGRRWVNYEIFRAWNRKMGVLGIHVHNIADSEGAVALKGANPFDDFELSTGRGRLSSVAPVHEAPFVEPKLALSYLATNIHEWIEEAIMIRRNYRG